MSYNKFLLLLSITIIFWLPASARISINPQFDVELRQRYEEALTRVGIDFHSNARLTDEIRLMKVESFMPALALLVDRQEKCVIPVLQQLLNKYTSRQKFLACERQDIYLICKALSELGDTRDPWKAVCTALMKNAGDGDIEKYEAARLLAQHGDGCGWPIVRDAFLKTQDNGVLYMIETMLPLFDGLRYEEYGSTHQIDVTRTCLHAAKLNLHRLEVALMALDKTAKPKDIEQIRYLQIDNDLPGMLKEIIDRLRATMHRTVSSKTEKDATGKQKR